MDRNLRRKHMKMVFIAILLLPMLTVYGNTIFEELKNPLVIEVDSNNYYLTDQFTIYVYSRKDNQLIKTLCKQGDGPGEVKNYPGINLVSNGLLVTDEFKVMLFNKDLDLIYEKKIPDMLRDWRFTAFREYIVYATSNISDSVMFNDIVMERLSSESNKKRLTTIKQVESKEVLNDLYYPMMILASSNEKVYVTDPTKGIHIEVFESNGYKSNIITYQNQNIKSATIHRDRFLDRLEESVGKRRAKDLYDRVFKNKRIPDIMPEIKWLLLDGNKLYVQTYDFRSGEDRWLVFTDEGKYVGECWLPLVHVRKADIFQDVFYYLRNTDEGWTLFTRAIKLN